MQTYAIRMFGEFQDFIDCQQSRVSCARRSYQMRSKSIRWITLLSQNHGRLIRFDQNDIGSAKSQRVEQIHSRETIIGRKDKNWRVSIHRFLLGCQSCLPFLISNRQGEHRNVFWNTSSFFYYIFLCRAFIFSEWSKMTHCIVIISFENAQNFGFCCVVALHCKYLTELRFGWIYD